MNLSKDNSEKVIGVLHGENHACLIIEAESSVLLRKNLLNQGLTEVKNNCFDLEICRECVDDCIFGIYEALCVLKTADQSALDGFSQYVPHD